MSTTLTNVTVRSYGPCDICGSRGGTLYIAEVNTGMGMLSLKSYRCQKHAPSATLANLNEPPHGAEGEGK